MIAIIAANNLYCSPYVEIYKEILGNTGLDFEIIYMNRENITGEETEKQHGMPWRLLRHAGKTLNKIYNYLRYRRFDLKIIKERRFSFLIILTALPAVVLADLLMFEYRGRYLVDIRDFTQEDHALYRILEKLLFRRAAMVTISSPAFMNFLPRKQKYVLSHNVTLRKLSLTEDTCRFTVKKNAPIIIGYVGFLSYPETCIALAMLVSRDKRFILRFHGEDSSGRVTDFVDRLRAENVLTMGRYRPEEKAEICKATDILFNAYGHGCPLLDYPLSNKYYDAVLFKKPVINSPGTFMHRSLEPISFAYDHERAQSLDDMHAWYQSLDPAAAEAFCHSAVEGIKLDIRQFSADLADAIGQHRV